MESVWLGYVEPLNGLVSDDLLKSANATRLSSFHGKQYRLGWYAVPIMWAYNKDLFGKAGLDADTPPTTLDELMAAGEKLKRKGITPIVGGLKDGYWGEWQMDHGLGPNLDSPAEALDLFAGSLDWREPKYWDHWAKIEQLRKAKLMNEDMLSLGLYAGIDLFNAGKGAMCSMVGPLLPGSQKALGAEKVWPMVFPAGGKGKMNGRPIADTQGLGISSRSKDKWAAADFLSFLHGGERLKAFYEQTRQMPADTTWNGDAALQDPGLKHLWKTWAQGSNAVPCISNLMPTLVWNEAMLVNTQKIVAGELSGEEAADNAAAVARKWRDQNPDLLEKFAEWANDLKL
jgi:multiple sugar transport system substrate-binding protein